MSAIQFHPNPTEGMIINVSPTKQMRFENGRWRLHTNNIPNLVESSYLGVPYISEEAPALPFSHKLWLKVSEGALHYQYDDGETVQWIAISGGVGGREVLTANRIYYVATTGSDSNDGLTEETPFRTIQKALDVCGELDYQNFSVTIQMADGIYTENLKLRNRLGSGLTTLQGNVSNPENTILAGTLGPTISSVGVAMEFVVQYFQIQNSGSATELIVSGSQGFIKIGNGMRFGQCVRAQLVTYDTGTIWVAGSYSIVGGATSHILSQRCGSIHFTGGIIVALQGTPAFSAAFAIGQVSGVISIYNTTFSGAATGMRYYAETNSIIAVYGAGESFLPGTISGQKVSGGQYS